MQGLSRHAAEYSETAHNMERGPRPRYGHQKEQGIKNDLVDVLKGYFSTQPASLACSMVEFQLTSTKSFPQQSSNSEVLQNILKYAAQCDLSTE